MLATLYYIYSEDQRHATLFLNSQDVLWFIVLPLEAPSVLARG